MQYALRVFITALFTGGIFSLVSAQDKDTLDFKGFNTPLKSAGNLNVVTSSPFSVFVGSIPLCGELRINYERMITYNQSFTVGGSYNYPNLMLALFSALSHSSNNYSNYSVRGGRVMLGYRYYPIKSLEAPAGLFVGPYFSYDMAIMKLRHGGNGDWEAFHYLNADAVVGYQVNAGNNVFIEVMAGFGYRKNYDVQYDARNDRTTVQDIYAIKAFKNFKFLLQYNIGYCF